MSRQKTWRPVPENEVTRAFTKMIIANEWRQHADCLVCRLEEVDPVALTLSPEVVASLRHALSMARRVARDYAASGQNGSVTNAAIAEGGYAAAEAWLDGISR